jgi:hypothetical protein
LGDTTPGIYFFKAICQDRLRLPKEALASYQKYLTLSNGISPDEEFKARQRIKVLEREVGRK